MRKPNLFMVGATRSGATALCEYLRTHPDIFIAEMKEIHYFTDDFPKYRMADSLEDYLKLFEGGTDDHRIVGESSALYMYSRVAIRKIHEFDRNAKIIVLLRNPADMVISFHSRQFYSALEDVKDFQKAWNLQAERLKGRHVPKNCLDLKMLQYSEIARLGTQSERLLEIFPGKQVKFVIFDELKKSTKSVYEDVLAFLEVPSDGREDFARHNVSVENKFDWLGAFIARPPRPIAYLANTYKRLTGLEKIPMAGKIHMLNSKPLKRPSLDPEFRSLLADTFKGEVEKLSRIVNKDLSSWSR